MGDLEGMVGVSYRCVNQLSGFSWIINVRWESFWEGFTFTGGIGIMGKLKN